MSDTGLTKQEIDDLFGGYAEALDINEDELAVSVECKLIRDALMEAAEVDGVGVNKFAKRLGVSPSVVSRMLRSEGDIRVSTVVLWARALGRKCNFTLTRMDASRSRGNFEQRWQVIDAAEPASSSETPLPTIRNLDVGLRDRTLVVLNEVPTSHGG